MTSTHKAKRGEQVATRISPQEATKLDALVESGAFRNRADAVRTAIRDMLSSISIVQERKVPFPRAKKEVLAYLDTNGESWASDIATELRLDLDLVIAVLQELRKSSQAVPDNRS